VTLGVDSYIRKGGGGKTETSHEVKEGKKEMGVHSEKRTEAPNFIRGSLRRKVRLISEFRITDVLKMRSERKELLKKNCSRVGGQFGQEG